MVDVRAVGNPAHRWVAVEDFGIRVDQSWKCIYEGEMDRDPDVIGTRSVVGVAQELYGLPSAAFQLPFDSRRAIGVWNGKCREGIDELDVGARFQECVPERALEPKRKVALVGRAW